MVIFVIKKRAHSIATQELLILAGNVSDLLWVEEFRRDRCFVELA